MALQPTASAPVSGPGMSGVWEVALGLLIVVAAIVAVGWVMRRLYPGAMSASQQMKVIAALPLGPRERLLLVDVAGTQLLLGVTAQQINQLHLFSEPVVLPPTPVAGDFALRLRDALGGAKRT